MKSHQPPSQGKSGHNNPQRTPSTASNPPVADGAVHSGLLSSSRLIQLQQAAGNKAVSRLPAPAHDKQSAVPHKPALQAKGIRIDSGNGVAGQAGQSSASLASQSPQSPQQTAQMKWHYSETRPVHGKNRTVYYHSSFDDADINSLHVTFADTEVYDKRSWAIRSSYTPTARTRGTWSAPDVNLGNKHSLNQQGISTLIESKISGPQAAARTDFVANATIKTALDAKFPADAPPVVLPGRWGKAGAGTGLAGALSAQQPAAPAGDQAAADDA